MKKDRYDYDDYDKYDDELELDTYDDDNYDDSNYDDNWDDDDDYEPSDTELLIAEMELTDEEEARNQRYQAENGPLFGFLNITTDLPLLTREEEIELGKLIKYGTEAEKAQAIDTLVVRNIRLVIYNAKKYKFPKVELDDLIQEGTIGLFKAAKKFDYSKNFKFATYATWWIKQAITRKGHEMSRTIRIPAHIITKRNKVNRALQSLSQDGLINPTVEDVYLAVNKELSKNQIKIIMEDISDAISLDVVISNHEGGSSSLLDFLDFEQTNDIEDLMHAADMNRILSLLMENLTPRERMIVTMRNGLFGENPMDVRQLSEVYGITRERIRQIYKSSLEKMKQTFEEKREEIII